MVHASWFWAMYLHHHIQCHKKIVNIGSGGELFFGIVLTLDIWGKFKKDQVSTHTCKSVELDKITVDE